MNDESITYVRVADNQPHPAGIYINAKQLVDSLSRHGYDDAASVVNRMAAIIETNRDDIILDAHKA